MGIHLRLIGRIVEVERSVVGEGVRLNEKTSILWECRYDLRHLQWSWSLHVPVIAQRAAIFSVVWDFTFAAWGAIMARRHKYKSTPGLRPVDEATRINIQEALKAFQESEETSETFDFCRVSSWGSLGVCTVLSRKGSILWSLHSLQQFLQSCHDTEHVDSVLDECYVRELIHSRLSWQERTLGLIGFSLSK